MAKVWLVTGCSSGLGHALVAELIMANQLVVATARNTASLEMFSSFPNVLIQPLDVTRKNEIDAAVALSIQKFGKIDVLVNNAGYGVVGSLEEASLEDIRRIFDTNFFGLIETTRAVLPQMRKQRSGHILNISSVAGIVSTPGLGIYNASKFAVEGLSEALAAEVRPFGIHVTIIEPGPFRTDFASRSVHVTAPMFEYEISVGATRRYIETVNGKQAGDPVRAAKVMIDLVGKTTPPLRLPLGELAFSRIRKKIVDLESELRAWELVGVKTDFPRTCG
jgi:short-subunit dehydrogenase